MTKYRPSIEAKDTDALATVMNATTKLILCNMNIGIEDMRNIATALHSNKTITSVNLAFNNISDDGAKVLATALESNDTIITINLSNNNIGDEGAKVLATALESNHTITTINLSNNNIGDEGAKVLATAFESNDTIITINLSNNNIGDEGAKALATALESNRTITTINLSNNNIGDECAKALVTALEFNDTITTINLSNNNIGDEGIKAVVVALAANKNKMTEYKSAIEAKDTDALATVMNATTKLILCNMNIGIEDMRNIATALHSNKTITSVNLAFNNISDDGAKEIAIALGTNTSVTTLNLRDNAIGDDGASALAHMLVTNKTLMNIKLSGNIGANYFASIIAAHADPRMWAISFEKLLMVNDQAMKLFGEDFEGKTMRDVNEQIIIPVCRKEKKSYALSTNEFGLKTDVFVSHSWDERFGNFVESIKQAYANKLRKPNLWICAFGLLQGNFEEIKSQLGTGQGALDQSPFVRALKGASNYLVVWNCNTDLCARIWCILEFVYAKEFELIPDKTIVTGPDTFADTNISCCDAKSFDPRDAEKILMELMDRNSVDEINEC